VEGTNKAHENGEAMGLVGVRLTEMLGRGGFGETEKDEKLNRVMSWMSKIICLPQCSLLC